MKKSESNTCMLYISRQTISILIDGSIPIKLQNSLDGSAATVSGLKCPNTAIHKCLWYRQSRNKA